MEDAPHEPEQRGEHEEAHGVAVQAGGPVLGAGELPGLEGGAPAILVDLVRDEAEGGNVDEGEEGEEDEVGDLAPRAEERVPVVLGLVLGVVGPGCRGSVHGTERIRCIAAVGQDGEVTLETV